MGKSWLSFRIFPRGGTSYHANFFGYANFSIALHQNFRGGAASGGSPFRRKPESVSLSAVHDHVCDQVAIVPMHVPCPVTRQAVTFSSRSEAPYLIINQIRQGPKLTFQPYLAALFFFF